MLTKAHSNNRHAWRGTFITVFMRCAALYVCLASLTLTLVGCAAVPSAAREVVEPAEAAPALPTQLPPKDIPTLQPSAASTAALAPSSTSTPEPTKSPEPSATPWTITKRQQLFEQVWQTIADHYLYPDFRGLDWEAVKEEFAPRVIAAANDAEFYAVLTEMVARLGDRHSRFLPPSIAERDDALSSGREEKVGIGVITVPTADGAMIRHIFPNGPASQAGLRPRDRIVAVDGVLYNAGGDIEGAEGSQVRLTVIRPGGHTRDVVLMRRVVEARIRPIMRRLDGDIGYLAVTTLWVNDMSDLVSGALTDLVVERPVRGLILDLRGNPGGWRDVLTGVLSHFVRGEVGDFFDQRDVTPLEIEERGGPDLRGLPLAVLIDNDTASYAELMAGILQAETGAIVVGTSSAGNTETIYAYELDGGARLWVAQEGFRLRNGVNLEGLGVQPDLELNLDWTRYSEDDDPFILESLRLLASQ